jgi:pimeloyl-ACP methyl ester carboxylesterase
MRTIVVAAIALSIVALAANTFWVDSKTRAASPRDGGQIVQTSVVPANVKAEGAGPPVVFLHGFGAALDWWDDIASDLVTDHRIIRIDLIGHGGTEAPSSGYAIHRQAALVSAILDKLSVDRATVIGHSMGGEVATALAEVKPERLQRSPGKWGGRGGGAKQPQQIPRPRLSGDPESYALYRDEVVDSVSAAAVGILAIFAIAS